MKTLKLCKKIIKSYQVLFLFLAQKRCEDYTQEEEMKRKKKEEKENRKRKEEEMTMIKGGGG